MYVPFNCIAVMMGLQKGNMMKGLGNEISLVMEIILLIENFNLDSLLAWPALNSLITKKQMTKFLSANFQKNVKSKLYHIENSKTRGQTV